MGDGYRVLYITWFFPMFVGWYRQRAFALFFQGGENEQLDDALVAECHSWPRHFCERKTEVGPAAAAIVKVHKAMDDTLRVLNHNRATTAITGPATTKQTYQAVNNGEKCMC
jgi:hypothetical protein